MKITLPLLFCAFIIFVNTASAQDHSPSFAVNTTSKVAVNSFECNSTNGKTILKWNIINNQDAEQFEVESSTDGKNFSMAALVFGTDKADSDDYLFYEKAKKKKTYYRLKIINKDRSVQYSGIVTP